MYKKQDHGTISLSIIGIFEFIKDQSMLHHKHLSLILLIGFTIVINTSKSQEASSPYIFPFQGEHVHSSSIVELPNEDLLVCWFQGSGERNANDVRVMGSRLIKGSTQWSSPFIMADTPGHPDCNPVLFVDPENTLKLFWIVVQANQWETSILKYRESSDFLNEGAPKWNWQDVLLLKPGEEFAETIKKEFEALPSRNLAWAEYAHKYENMIYEAAKEPKKKETGWMTRTHPTVLSNGRILLPLYSDGYNLSLIAISDDGSKTWTHSKPIVGYGNVQPSIIEKEDGTLVAYMRDNGDAPATILISYSMDKGYTWTSAKESDIPNPGSSVEALKLHNNDWVIVYNDTQKGRNSLVISLSDDEGKTWKWIKTLDRSGNPNKDSYSYPSVIQTKDGKIHVTYSFKEEKNKTIKHVSFSPKWVKK